MSADPRPLSLDAAPCRAGPGPGPPHHLPAQRPRPADTPEARASRTTPEPAGGGLTAGADVAAGVGGVHLRGHVGAILLTLQAGLRPACLGLADDAAPALQASAVLAVELEVFPILQGRGAHPRQRKTAPRRLAHRATGGKPRALPTSAPGAGSGEDTRTRTGTCSHVVPRPGTWQRHQACLRGSRRAELKNQPRAGATHTTQQTGRRCSQSIQLLVGRWWGAGGWAPRYLNLPGLQGLISLPLRVPGFHPTPTCPPKRRARGRAWPRHRGGGLPLWARCRAPHSLGERGDRPCELGPCHRRWA